MTRIDLFNKTAEETKIHEALVNNAPIDSKLVFKYAAKTFAQSVIIGAVAGLAITGALCIIADALNNDNEEDNE